MGDFVNSILDPGFLVGIIFMLMGCIMYYRPPKKPNAFYGYRTTSSMKSQEHWVFSQRFSTIKMIQSGAALFILSLCGYFIDPDFRSAVGMLIFFVAIRYIFVATERAIKKRFKD